MDPSADEPHRDQAPPWLSRPPESARRESSPFGLAEDHSSYVLRLPGLEMEWDLDQPITVQLSRSASQTWWRRLLKRRRHRLLVTLRQGERSLDLEAWVGAGEDAKGLVSGLPWLDGDGHPCEPQALIDVVQSVLEGPGRLSHWDVDATRAPWERAEESAEPTYSWWRLPASALIRLLVGSFFMIEAELALTNDGLRDGFAPIPDLPLAGVEVGLSLAALQWWLFPGRHQARAVEWLPLVLFPLLAVLHPWCELAVGLETGQPTRAFLGFLVLFGSLLPYVIGTEQVQRFVRRERRGPRLFSGWRLLAYLSLRPRPNARGGAYVRVKLTGRNVHRVVHHAARGVRYEIEAFAPFDDWEEPLLVALEANRIRCIFAHDNGRYEERVPLKGGDDVRERYARSKLLEVLPSKG